MGNIQDNMSRMEVAVANKFSQMETIIDRLSKILQANKTTFSSNNSDPHTNTTTGHFRNTIEDGRKPQFTLKLAKIEFPHFCGDDPTEWFTRVEQFFDYQATPELQKVSLASFHLEGGANQWW
ncbi:hypothetical protein AgCh_004959 [Apium graveolens]